MLQNLGSLLRIYRDKLVLIVLILGMPWAWAFFWVPWWVNVVCVLLVPVAAALLIFHVLPQPPHPRRAEDDPKVPDAQFRKMRKVSLGMNTLLGRWSQATDQSRQSIEELLRHVDEVIQISESSVIEIGNKFVAVTRKTRKQVEHALALLEHTQSGSATPRSSRPLPDLVTAYGDLLGRISANLEKITETAEQLERRHETVREAFKHVDTLLDQLSAHDSQIGMMALNTSVAAGTSSSDVVSVADQIRTLSLESKAFTRDIRRTLEQVRSQHQHTQGAVREAVRQAHEVAQLAGAEGEKLGREMLFNGQELNETLSQIGALGNEIQKDINDIIVALQFQDITQQKLQRLKNPLLTDLMASLRVIFDETRVMSGKLQGSGLVEAHAFQAETPETDGGTAAPAAGTPPGRRKGDEAVEIF